MHEIDLLPPDTARFMPYGRLLPLATPQPGRPINGGTSLRHDLPAALDLGRGGGVPALAVFQARAQAPAGPWQVLERHPHGSQTFIPLAPVRWVALVARGAAQPDPATLAAFALDAGWGLTLAPGTWHHGLIALDAARFLVLERRAAEEDCELAHLQVPVRLRPGGVTPWGGG